MLKKGLQLCSRLEKILNVPPEGTPPVFFSSAAALDGFLSILRIHPQRSVGYGTIQYFY
jgi:hypothetical protein